MAIATKLSEDISNAGGRIKAASSKEEMDTAIQTLQAQKDVWVRNPVTEKIKFLENAIQRFGQIMEDWVAKNLIAKGAVDNPYAVGLEWIGGPVTVLRYLQGLRKSLTDVQHNQSPRFPGPVSTLPNGQLAVQIYPSSLYERIVTPGVTTEVWMDAAVSVDNLTETQAVYYKQPRKTGSVVLVLGGGNVAGIPINDSLFKLFVETQVVLLKMNPVNAYLGPLIEDCFQQLVTKGFLRIVYGGAEEGNYLCHHLGIDEIHMTGSDKTFDAIVFGSGDAGRQRKREIQPLITKRFTSELGNIAPAIIVPGPWGEGDFAYQAEQLVSHLCDNASFSCSRTRVILTHESWPARKKLHQSIRKILADVPLRTAYYPGSKELHQRFLTAHPEAEIYGTPSEDQLPWTFIANVTPDKREDICFKTESFCPVIAETAIQASSIAEYIDRAVEFSNHTLWGTLSATIIVHPKSLQDPEVSQAVDRAIQNLLAGTVVINGIPGMAWVMTTPPWGSFPGNEIQDIQSGTGHVHNVYMFSLPEKTVVRCPFRMMPKPIWFNSKAQSYQAVTKKIAHYDLEPSWWKIPGIVLAALIG